ncbi:OmpA family protein [Agaribacter flavus]|uniref:OmpA family protein n=1 Tax=Agaribacter flavus TaxID=1902781 RepID=A0ABV7FSR6_9ALTE
MPSEPSEQLVSENKKVDAVQRAKEDLDKLRELLLSTPLNEQRAEIQRNARQMVSEVVAEAINDREKLDKSVSQVLMPVVERSIQQSFKQQRKEIVDYVFPLVGELARKYIASSLREFIDKTNELIEHSLSPKGLKWRYEAWRSGMSFAKYIIAKTHIFKIHQVLLIHKETGILLNSVSAEGVADDNSVLVSSMLTAINDFVADSFSDHLSNEEQTLSEIKTKEFSLYLKQGPSALIVVSVTGLLSPAAKHQLQTTLEHIHKLHADKLTSFDGDTQAFSDTDSALFSCLMSEQKRAEKEKSTWLASTAIAGVALLVGWWGFLYWQTASASTQLQQMLTGVNGIELKQLEIKGIHNIHLTVLRDPSAISLTDWLKQTSIEQDWLHIAERPTISFSKTVIYRKVAALSERFPNILFENGKLSLLPEKQNALSLHQFIEFETSLQNIPGVELTTLSEDLFSIKRQITTFAQKTNAEVTEKVLGQLIGEISSIQIEFSINKSEVSPSELTKISLIAQKLNKIKIITERMNKTPLLLILGTSDTQGTQTRNQILSIERAENVKTMLMQQGIDERYLQAFAAGQIESDRLSSSARKAIFSIMY